LKIFINASSGVPIYRQIIQQIENGVVGGILNPGEQLPTVREVALNLTINPNTVARAYRELESNGVIESIQGRGTYVSKNVPHLSKLKSSYFSEELPLFITRTITGNHLAMNY